MFGMYEILDSSFRRVKRNRIKKLYLKIDYRGPFN